MASFQSSFLMAFLSIWSRCSNALTSAKWIRTCFRDSAGGTTSATLVAFALLSVLGFLTCGFVGVGKFVEIFIPGKTVAPYVPFNTSLEHTFQFYGLVSISLATLGCMLDITWEDIMQLSTMMIAALGVASTVIASTVIASTANTAPTDVLKGDLWRLSNWGYFGSMIIGLMCALAFPPTFNLILPSIAPDILPLYMFPIILIISGIICIIGRLLTQPEGEKRAVNFYSPALAQGSVLAKLKKEDPESAATPYFKRDMFNIAVGVCLQTALAALPIFIVIKMPTNAFMAAGIIAVVVCALRKTWHALIVDWLADEIVREKALITRATF